MLNDEQGILNAEVPQDRQSAISRHQTIPSALFDQQYQMVRRSIVSKPLKRT